MTTHVLKQNWREVIIADVSLESVERWNLYVICPACNQITYKYRNCSKCRCSLEYLGDDDKPLAGRMPTFPITRVVASKYQAIVQHVICDDDGAIHISEEWHGDLTPDRAGELLYNRWELVEDLPEDPLRTHTWIIRRRS